MPIEDVDYMRQHSIKQSYIFMIDSADRDHFQFPIPSTYTVTFDQPFTNVFGLEVIDANVPNSTYNVDGGNELYPTNNTITFYIHDNTVDISKVNPANYTTVAITPGNYTVQTLIATINGSSLLQMNVNSNVKMPKATISIQSLSNPPEVNNTLVFTCPYPFVIDMSQTTMSETLGFDLLTTANMNESKLPLLQQRFTTFIPPIIPISTTTAPSFTQQHTPQNTQSITPSTPQSITYPTIYKYQEYSMYHSVDLPPNLGLGNPNITYIGPTGIIRKQPISTSNYIAQSFEVPYNCYLTGVAAALGSSTGQIDGPAYWSLYKNNSNIKFDNNYPGVPGTRIELTNVDTDFNTGLFDTDYIDGGYTPTTPVSTDTTPIFAKLEPGIYWVVISAPGTPGNTSLYYNDVPLVNGKTLNRFMLVSSNKGINYSPLSQENIGDGLQFISSLQITIQQEYHKLTAPGIYSLMGQRFMVLRCKEIEDSSLRSLAYTKHCLGLAKFTLGVVGMSTNRMDFSSVPLREFFPIGKLSKLSFRFETINGMLYDFKGVNHTLTFAIHYYEATQKTQFKTGLLNPNYTGNYLVDIQYGCGGDSGEEDSDDHEFDYNRDNFEESYNAREHRHLPSTIRDMDKAALQKFQLNEYDYELLNNNNNTSLKINNEDTYSDYNEDIEESNTTTPQHLFWNT